MIILVVFNSFNVVKNLKKPDPVARQMPPFNTTNVLIYGKPFFEIPLNNKKGAYEQIIEMRRSNGYATGNLLDYEYFSKHYKPIAIDLSKQTELENPDLKKQINFIGRLKENNAAIFFIIEKKEETTFDFSQNFVSVV